VTSHELTREFAEDLKSQIERGFNERKPEVIEAVLADRLIDHNVLLGGVDLRQRIARVQEAFEDARLSIDQYIIQGNAAAWRWTITGTHTQSIMGIEPTGKVLSISGLSAAIIQNGKVVQHWEFSDDQTLLAQLQAATA
jgi:steroid delta-isomerase-like uncharacterized protein